MIIKTKTGIKIVREAKRQELEDWLSYAVTALVIVALLFAVYFVCDFLEFNSRF